MVDCMLLLLTGDVITGLTCTWTNLIDIYFYALVIAVFEIFIVVKYDNILAASLFGMVNGLLMIGLLPTAIWSLPVFIFLVNGGVVLYSLVTRE